jgi:hypothetical protein
MLKKLTLPGDFKGTFYKKSNRALYTGLKRTTYKFNSSKIMREKNLLSYAKRRKKHLN